MEGVEEGTVWDGGGHRYQLEKVVGHGAFGIVWRARTEDGEIVAIKKVLLDRRYHNRELQMMKVMEHDNVVRLRHSFEKNGRKKDETFLHLVMDYLPETIRSIALKYHKRAKRFHPDHIKAYLWQTFGALEYIHARRICHRDIKPDNLLCDPASLKCRLCDFGCSKVLVKGQPNVSYICSRYYRAPELMFGATEYSVSVDVWSVGTILMELLLGHLPYQGQDSTQQHLVEIMKLLGTPTDHDLQAMRATCCADDLPKLKAYPWERMFPAQTPEAAIDLAQRLLNYDPEKRLTASMALRHAFFDGVESLVEGCTVPSTSSTPMPPPQPSAIEGSRQTITAAEWERRVGAHFDEVRGGMPAQLSETVLRHVEHTLRSDSLSDATSTAVVTSVRQDLAAALRQRDETIRVLQQRIAHEAQRRQLPCEGASSSAADGGAGSGAAAAASASASGASGAARMAQQQLADLKEAQRQLNEALAEKEALAARLKAAQRQIEALHAQPRGGAGGGGANSEESREQGEESESSRAHAASFGRRAPPMPTRQGTLDQMPASGPSPAVRKPPLGGLQLQTDNLGTVPPIGLSPTTPGAARVASASGRRRSRLADGSKEDAHADPEPEAQ
jgi:serine/threonine protein kinase